MPLNMKTIKIIFSILAGIFLIVSCENSTKSGNSGNVSDIDGNVYSTVTIGGQTWMTENLRTTKYNDGIAIPNVTDEAWTELKTGAFSWYNNDSAAFKSTYGAVYNWYTVHTGKTVSDRMACPHRQGVENINRFFGWRVSCRQRDENDHRLEQ